MAAGDASRTWFSEMVETLRREWKPDMLWEEIIALRDRLDAMLQQIRLSRGIRPPAMWCPVCNERTQQVEPTVSVRAVIFALGRFGIVSQVEFKLLEKRWAKYRKENGLDRNGRAACQGAGGQHDGQEDGAVGGVLPMMAAGDGRDRLRAVREIGRQTRQCLSVR